MKTERYKEMKGNEENKEKKKNVDSKRLKCKIKQGKMMTGKN